MSARIPVFSERPKAAPTPKLRALVKYPGNIIGTTGIEVTKANGNVTIETDWTDFGAISAIPTSPTSYILTFDTATGAYILVPSHLLGGTASGIADAPVDGIQYGRQSGTWTPTAEGGFLQVGTGAVWRTMLDKARESVSVKDFGAVGNGSADDTAAINLAINSGAKCIVFPAGTYNTTGSHDLNGNNGLQLIGTGVGSSFINITHASNTLFTTGATPTSNILIAGFTITSTSVTRTGGFVFATFDVFNGAGSLLRSMLRDLQIEKQVNGLWISKYEFVNVEDIMMFNWVGTNGIGLKIGQTTTANDNQGSQCYIKNVQIYGNDLIGGPPILYWGVVVEDCDAIQAECLGVGGPLVTDVKFIANAGGHSPSNHFFIDCVFDSTGLGACVEFTGGGIYQDFMFTGCWFAGAGTIGPTGAEAPGIDFNDTASAYSNINFVGGVIHLCNGSGVYIAKGGSLVFSGVKITRNSRAAAINKYGMFVNPTAAAPLGLVISGCFFSNFATDLVFTGTSRDYLVTGCYFGVGVTNLGASYLIEGNYDKGSNTVASAGTITVPSTKRSINITGTTNIGGIVATFSDHIVQLKFASALVVIDNVQNLKLNGNFTVAAGSTLTLMCDGVNWNEIGRRT